MICLIKCNLQIIAFAFFTLKDLFWRSIFVPNKGNQVGWLRSACPIASAAYI